MISPDEFVDFLEQKDLLAAKLIASLRRQLAETKVPISAALVAKKLVDSGHLSHRLAQRLLEQADAQGKPRGKPQGPGRRNVKASDELGLAPLDEEESDRGARKPEPRKRPSAPEEDLATTKDFVPLDKELAPLEEAVPPPDDIGLVPLEESDSAEQSQYGLAPLDEEPVRGKKMPELTPLDDRDGEDELVPLDELVPMDELLPLEEPKKAPSRKPAPRDAGPASGPTPPPKPRPQAPSSPPKSSKPAGPPAESRPQKRPRPEDGTRRKRGERQDAPVLMDAKLASAAAADLAAAPAAAAGLDRYRRKGKGGGKGNVWDSPLLLIGGGLLLGLLILAGALTWAVMRQGGDALLKIADDDYTAGSYSKAIQEYGMFLEKAPNHPKANEAKIRRGLAQMRQATDGTSSWPTALETTKGVLSEISRESGFRSMTQGELAAMLPKIAEGLANQARKQPKEELVDQAEETLALIEKYINKDVRPDAKVADIRAMLALTRRDISRSQRLETSVTEMGKAVADGKIADAYQIRASLLKEYPDLIGDEKLMAATLAASQAEQGAVKFVAKEQAAETKAAETPPPTAVTFARRETIKEVPAAKGCVVCALAGGAAYGLDAVTGKVVWRQPVGFSENGRSPSFPPTPVSRAPGSDILLIDSLHNAVVRLRASDGTTVWRFPVGERLDAYPVIDGEQLWVATRSGRLVKVDLASGASSGYVQFPQELRTGPAVDSQRGVLFQAAEHSNLFIVSAADGKCVSVYYLGHEPGSVLFPPVVLGDFLVVASSHDSQSTALEVFRIGKEKDGLKLEPLEGLNIKGRVATPLVVADRRLLVMTDKADLAVLEASDADPKKPLNIIAQGAAGSEENLVRYPLLLQGQFLVGDNQLTCFDILASRGRLQSRWTANLRSTTLQPLMWVGESVVQVRQRRGLPGVAVSAVSADEGKTLWETHLAAPLVGEPSYEESSGVLTAFTSSGGMFELKADELAKGAVIDEPKMGLKLTEVRQPVSDAIRLERQVTAVIQGKGAHEVSIYHSSDGRIRQLPLPDALGGPTAGMAGALITPLKPGEVFLLDPFSGEKRCEAFQPPTEAGEAFAWQRPLVIGSGEMLLTDGRRAVYRVVVEESPKACLTAKNTLELASPIVSQLAAAGKTGFAATADGKLMSFTLPDMKEGSSWPLRGRCTWGPWAVGDRVVVASNEQLMCADGKAQLWQVALPSGPLVGAPLNDGKSVIVASAKGIVLRLDAGTGKEEAKVDVGLPLGTGPVVVKDQLVVGSYDGSLYQIQKP